MTVPQHPGGRPARRLAGAILAALLVLLSAACSDAPTEKEIAMADDGIDPSIVPIFTSPALLTMVNDLGNIFLVEHPGVTFQYTAKDPDTLAQRARGAVKPALWIDDRAALEPLIAEGETVGEPGVVGDDPMQMVILKSFKGERPTLEVFGPGTFPAQSGLCDVAAACGQAAREILAQAGITPEPDFTLATGRDVVVAMGTKDQFQTGLVYRSEAAGLVTKFSVIKLPDPAIGLRTYQSVRLRDDSIGAAFQDWIATSPDAEAILVKKGLRPRPGAKAT
jgi:hypothetical protein